MKKILFIVLALISCVRANAQPLIWEEICSYPFYYSGIDGPIFYLTKERQEKLSIVKETIAKISGSFFSDMFSHGGSEWNNIFCGIPFAVDAKEGDVITISFDFANVDNIAHVMKSLPKYGRKKTYISRASILVPDETYINVYTESDSSWYWGEEKLLYDPAYNSVAIKQPADGVAYPFVRSAFVGIDSVDVDPIFTIFVRRYGKLTSVQFEVDPQATFDITDQDGMLMYNLQRYIRVSATDTYGNDVPIMNSLVSQWQVDKETGIARFTPILYPFSCTIDGFDDSYETDATNKSASTEDDAPNAGTTLDNCMTLEAVNPNMLLLDLNKGGIVTHVANVNANATAQDVWYDMFGRKYTTKPIAKGLYIHNGKKEVVK